MWHRSPLVIVMVLLGSGSLAWRADAQATTSLDELKQHVANLSALDYQVRMHAARLIRRTPGPVAVPALVEAARGHSNEFVRYRALVLLTAFNDPGTGRLMLDLRSDPNDRVRQVVYQWLERRPDPRIADTLIAQLQTEQAEFVRPALVAALAALRDPAVYRAMIAETARGRDFFRSAVIEALGRHRAAYALDAVVSVARLVGPLQDDAVLAVGRIGGPDAASVLSDLTEMTPEAAVMMRGARCLIGQRCAEQLEAVAALAATPGARPGEVRAALDALAAVAQARSEEAVAVLMRMATPESPLRERVSVAWASVALRQPEWTVTWLEASEEATREAAIELLKDGFDSLEEDMAEEQFFASVRAGYWRADEGSSGRALRAALIQRLEF